MTVTVTPVRFEHHDDPIGIGEAAPRLSWIVESAPPGWQAAGYELERRGGRSVAVESDESVLVAWPFEPLVSRERAEVRVRVTGTDGVASTWGEWAAVETGLLDPDDWAAQLIGPSDDAVAIPLLRRVFQGSLPSPLARSFPWGPRDGRRGNQVSVHSGSFDAPYLDVRTSRERKEAHVCCDTKIPHQEQRAGRAGIRLTFVCDRRLGGGRPGPHAHPG